MNRTESQAKNVQKDQLIPVTFVSTDYDQIYVQIRCPNIADYHQMQESLQNSQLEQLHIDQLVSSFFVLYL